MYLISVYFDEQTNQTLQRYIQKIANATGNTFMTDHRVPPHLTISSIEARSSEVLIPAVRALCSNHPQTKTGNPDSSGPAFGLTSGSIRIASIGQLLPYVFFAAPVMNSYLLRLSEQVYDAVKDIPETTVSRYYRPFSWMPHITLGKTLTSAQMQQAFAVMQENFTPIEASVTRLSLARVNPHEDVITFSLPEH